MGSRHERSVAVVGLGSRGLSVLERIVTLASRPGAQASQIRVEIIDPSCSGSGVHDPGQPDYLLLNTTCSQVSMFPDSRSVGPETGPPGPSLYTWAAERGLRLAADGYTVGRTGRPIRPTDFLPRRVLGDYLSWFLRQLRARAPAHVRLNLHCAVALDMTSEPDGMLAITLSDGSLARVAYAYLTTGYTDNTRPAVTTSQASGPDRVIADPYPLPGRVADVAPGQRVAIGGFGLSAMDLMSCLTVGRGGQFAERDGRLEYQPSGREPLLLMYSRSGVPCRARPRVVEFGPKYQPLAFTEAAIDAARGTTGGPLDFDEDLLPLVLTEMRIAYRRCQARRTGIDAEQALAGEVADHASIAELRVALDQLDARLGSFDPGRILDGSADMSLADSAAYQRWLAGYVAEDLAEAVLGFSGSPVKAALDILRELRDTFRYGVDFGGLTATSLDEFTRRTIPMINRAVVGPQYERHVELLALTAAGIAQTPFGPAPRVRWNDRRDGWTISSTRLGTALSVDVDWLVSAHVPLPSVESSANPLISAMYRKGWIRAHKPGSSFVHGIDVDRDQHPLDRRGCPDVRLWVLGPLCEGATFYNNLVPSPDVYSRPVFDAHRCVAAMFASGGQSPRHGTGGPPAVAIGTVASGRPA